MGELWNEITEIGSQAIGAVTEAAESVSNAASSSITDAIAHFFYSVVYSIVKGLCWIVGILDQMFEVMSGSVYVTYDGAKSLLVNVFFQNTAVTNAYWGMAMIGVVLSFVFAIIAVARKSVDINDKIRQSLGGILTSLMKGILMIISMSAVMVVVLNLSNILLQQVNYVFVNAQNMNEKQTIEFKDEQYAAMARVLDTIGNYSLNPSYDSRYNMNSCFNAIRGDLQFLRQTGVFDFYYEPQVGADGKAKESWQSMLQDIAHAANLNQDLSMDIYNDGVVKSIKAVMDEMRTNASFAPLQSYTRQYTATSEVVTLDRIVFLMCTMKAAKNTDLNLNPSLGDSLRAPYYYGEKSIYDFSQVDADFDITDIDYIVMICVCLKMIWDLFVVIMNCIARIFNMLLLYLVAPPVLATMPMDEGGKFKQWSTAFMIQCFGVLGTIIAMRLLLMFIPIVIDSKLVVFDNSVMNLLAKVLIILGGMETAKRASGMITGILADNAGMQAIHAGDMGESVRSGVSQGFGYAGSTLKWAYNKAAHHGPKTPEGGGGSYSTVTKQDIVDGGESLPRNESSKGGGKDAGGGAGESGAGLPRSEGGGGNGNLPGSNATRQWDSVDDFMKGYGADGGQEQNPGGNDNLPGNNAARQWDSVDDFMNGYGADGGQGQNPGGNDNLPGNNATRQWDSVDDFMKGYGADGGQGQNPGGNDNLPGSNAARQWDSVDDFMKGYGADNNQVNGPIADSVVDAKQNAPQNVVQNAPQNVVQNAPAKMPPPRRFTIPGTKPPVKEGEDALSKP